MPSVVEDLERVPLFSGLSPRQLRQLAKNFTDRRVPAGSVLVRQDEMSGVAFFVIAEGEAAVIVDGTRVGTLGPGDHFGELAMISESERTATVEAVTPMRCHTIQFWHFRAFAKKNPDVTWKLLQHVAGIVLKEQSRHAAHAENASR
ncbi:MAG: cyclic nucleotide-binding domain-containing protein [Friedmanniella sp.]